MDSWASQVWREIAERPEGPFAFRFYLQPAMAAFFALRDGLKDARTAKPAYFWELLSNPPNRRDLIHEGWKSIAKVFIMAIVIDVIYQLIVLHAIRPAQTLLVATFLAIVPYVCLRGPINRITRRTRRGPPSDEIAA